MLALNRKLLQLSIKLRLIAPVIIFCRGFALFRGGGGGGGAGGAQSSNLPRHSREIKKVRRRHLVGRESAAGTRVGATGLCNSRIVHYD